MMVAVNRLAGATPLAVFECREITGRDWPRTLVTYELQTADQRPQTVDHGGVIRLAAPIKPDAVHLIDPLAALVVAALILKAAWTLTVQSTRDLVDVSLPEEEEWIRGVIQEFVPRVHAYHRMRTRKAGATRFADFHIRVDGQMTVETSHKLAHEISGRIKEHFEGADVTVHVEPYDEEMAARAARSAAGRD